MKLDFTLDQSMHIRVQATVNGSDPVDFHVDTGARATTISKALVDRLKIETYEEERESAGITHQSTFARVDSLGIGTDVFEDEEVLVMDLHRMFGPGAPFGNIGHTTLKHYLVSVDYSASTIRLERGTPDDARGKDDMEWIDFHYVGGSHLVGVATLVNGEGPFEFVVETGSGISILSPELADKLNLGGNMQEIQVLGVDGLATAHLAMIEDLAIGTASQKDLQVLVMDSGKVAKSGSLIKHGAIAYNFLKSFETIIDYPNMRLSFAPK
ncbi:MAG: aspartyl protease family protein [Candidatus Thorarchaeota archaeon]